jgi:ATP-dependent Clp protease protease subunit
MTNNIVALKSQHAATQFTAKKVNKRGELYLYGIIGETWFGDGVSAKRFADELKKLGDVDTIDLYLNSDGGVVTEARSMYNRLVEHKAKVNVHIDGIAASAASFLAMAGDTIEIAEGGFVMIHNARGMAFGEAEELEKMANVLRTVNRTIVDTYVARTGQKRSDIESWMKAETWFTGKEAVDKGFATAIVANKTAVACLHPEIVKDFRNMPRDLRPNRARAVAALAQLRGK